MDLNTILRNWFESLLPMFGWGGTFIVSVMVLVLARQAWAVARARREDAELDEMARRRGY